MDTLGLTLSPREITGKKVKLLRREGLVPVHMYGSGIQDIPLQVDSLKLRKVLIQAGANVPVNIAVDGMDIDNICFIREVQRHPVSEEILHTLTQ